MPLFIVNIESEFVVEAKDKNDAEKYSKSNIDDILRDEGNDIFTFSAREITNEKNIPGWAIEYIPYNGDGYSTVEEILHVTEEELKLKKDKEFANSKQLKLEL